MVGFRYPASSASTSIYLAATTFAAQSVTGRVLLQHFCTAAPTTVNNHADTTDGVHPTMQM